VFLSINVSMNRVQPEKFVEGGAFLLRQGKEVEPLEALIGQANR
jgi:hypothetical protein